MRTWAIFLACLACGKRPPPPPPVEAPLETTGSGLYRSEACATGCPFEPGVFRSLAEGAHILAVGEAHAQRGDSVEPTVRRFQREFLSESAQAVSGVLVELMVAPKDCQAVEEVAKKQGTITQNHPPATSDAFASQNQADYVALLEGAKAHGLPADLLHPTCSDLRAVRQAKGEFVTATLSLVTELTARSVGLFFSESRRGPLLIYGGAMHNDLLPTEERERFSVPQRLGTKFSDTFVEVDLFQRGQIRDTPLWQAHAWYAAYRGTPPDQDVLLRVTPRSFVIILR